ncbi:hypothetical protein CGCA056_v008941 [Colletotrichum aenigma]|uniref:uncharacterized protein n=1 Tax=Colletotrichum aenigma TaxID=1215731 RepID=UPI00187331CA|nr:uncharacterized protein CGCA056_v008941 [Colletotrichum aenigma]KAF5520973.1 hypothetical protein CGCA056_v008941 [Colletotrichum aenigma]
MQVSSAFLAVLVACSAGVSALPWVFRASRLAVCQQPLTAVDRNLSLLLILDVLERRQAITRKATDFGTYFCQTRTDAGSKIVANNNFCKAAGGAVLASEGFCCIRNNNFKVPQAMVKGCNDNKLVFSQNDTPCSP